MRARTDSLPSTDTHEDILKTETRPSSGAPILLVLVHVPSLRGTTVTMDAGISLPRLSEIVVVHAGSQEPGARVFLHKHAPCSPACPVILGWSCDVSMKNPGAQQPTTLVSKTNQSPNMDGIHDSRVLLTTYAVGMLSFPVGKKAQCSNKAAGLLSPVRLAASLPRTEAPAPTPQEQGVPNLLQNLHAGGMLVNTKNLGTEAVVSFS
jgi:hypothetical protein